MNQPNVPASIEPAAKDNAFFKEEVKEEKEEKVEPECVLCGMYFIESLDEPWFCFECCDDFCEDCFFGENVENMEYLEKAKVECCSLCREKPNE